MKTLKVGCTCLVSYTSNIQIPDNYSLEEAIQYVKKNFDKVPRNLQNAEPIYDSDLIIPEECELM